jgi:hypothetical protein
VISPQNGDWWLHIAALIDDHGHPGVWLKYYGVSGGFQPGCNYNAPGTCAQCGCNIRNAPACTY